VSPERDDPTDDQDLYEDVPPRSIFAATWFRVVLVLIVLGVFGAVAVPYVLDWMNPPPVSRSVSAKATAPPPAAPISPTPASESTTSPGTSMTSSAEKSSTMEKSSSVEKKDPTLASPAAPLSTAKPETKPEPKPTPVAKPPAPKTEAKSVETTKSAMAAKPESTPKSHVVAKADAPAKDETKAAVATTAPTTKRAAAKATPAESTTQKPSGTFWVQVGAFRDIDTAKRVATALRDQNYKVEESDTQVSAKAASGSSSSAAAPSPAASPGDLYDVHVTGMSAVELTKRLSAKGLSAESQGGSVVVKPSLPLRDAVSLSKDLAVDGLKVQVRRAGSGAVAAAPATTPAPAPATAGETLHRVRIGPFTDVAAVRSAAKELEGKGYKPFIARGDQ
jgi:cell division septation protein DedD